MPHSDDLPDRLRLDFTIPDEDPLTMDQVVKALRSSRHCSRSDVFNWIYEGRLQAIDVSRDGCEREDYIIPLKAFIHFINSEYPPEELYFRFPEANMLNPPRIARAMGKSKAHVYRLIQDGEFPNAANLARASSKYPNWEIPLADLVRFINRRGEGFFA
ncbi:MAG: helix-turn-helix domain-containing protein [Kiritimatiellales bacterium]|nr:helix-turn-helix domain-containing protein [Kiritimatiellales bacterium]